MPKSQPALSEQYEQLRMQFTWAEQEAYEEIRPMVLHGQSALERAREIGVSRSRLTRNQQRFRQQGIRGLFPQKKSAESTAPNPLPPHMRRFIRSLKGEYPDFKANEIAICCYVTYGRQPSHHTVEKVIDEAPIERPLHRRFPPYATVTDAVERRMAIIRLHLEGWPIVRIAGYLQTTRRRVYQTLDRWWEGGEHGLHDHSHARKSPRKVTMQTIEQVRKMQVNPRLGAFRVAAAYEQQTGERLSMRTMGRILKLNRDLYPEFAPPEQPKRPRKPMPYATDIPHAIWTIDVRYITQHHCQDFQGTAYIISILDNASRAAIASMISPNQNLGSYLRVLYAAIHQHGVPDMILTDGGKIFTANEVLAIYEALGINKDLYEALRPWMSYIESMFSVQKRMIDFAFEQAMSWEELSLTHARWYADYNHQSHFAHKDRGDDKHSPYAVLDGALGRLYAVDQIQPLFPLRYQRRLDRHGYLHFQHWRLYGEEALAGKGTTLWLYKELLTVTFAETHLAHYAVDYVLSSNQVHDIHDPHFYQSRYTSKQLRLWNLGQVDWYPVQYHQPTPRHRRQHKARDLSQLTFWEAIS